VPKLNLKRRVAVGGGRWPARNARPSFLAFHPNKKFLLCRQRRAGDRQPFAIDGPKTGQSDLSQQAESADLAEASSSFAIVVEPTGKKRPDLPN